MLGFPFPEVADPRNLSTGIDSLDRLLVRWLDRHEGERDMRREGDRCVLVDRGIEIREVTASDYCDSVRKCLQQGLDADFFERRFGRRLGPDD